jgi:septum formation protein
MEEKTVKLILASASPRRKAILEACGLDFETAVSNAEETFEGFLEPEFLAEKLSLLKACDAARRFGRDALVIGADTVVVLDGAVFGKPKDEADAARMLSALSGRTHRVLTGLSVVRNADGKCVSVFEETRVTFRRLTAEETGAYIQTGEPMDKAGAYAIQGGGAAFAEKVEGDLQNVIGLPSARLFSLLKDEFDLDLTEDK